MYDKSIVSEYGVYIPIVRENGIVIRLQACHTIEEAQALLATLPPDDEEVGSFEPCSQSVSEARDRMERKLAVEDWFEDLLTRAEVCR